MTYTTHPPEGPPTMTTTADLRTPSRVEVTPYVDHEGMPTTWLLVSPIWDGVDRPNTGGIVVTSKRNADRLKAAYLAGVVFKTAEVKTDVEGETYVATHSLVMAKYLNADLKKLGF